MVNLLKQKPAIEGGKPVRKKFLPPFFPCIGKEEINEVVDTLKSGWLTTGPKTHKFEQMVQKYLGAENCLALSSCTAALHLALVVCGVKEDDEVITSPFTFVSTVNVVLHQGAKPVFVDIDRKTFNIDVSKIEKAITKKTEAIIPVHFAGYPCDMNELTKIAKKHNLIVIEDAAHAFGSKYKGRKIGAISNFTAFSFYAAKNLTTAEGGMLCIENKKIAEKARILSLHGLSKDAWKRYSQKGSWHYEVLFPGYKYNMPDVLASLGMHQLRKIDKFINKKQKIAAIYKKELGSFKELVIPEVKTNLRHSWYLYPILINSEFLKINRNQFIEALKAENIGASVHFIPVHLHPFYKEKFGFKKGDFPNAEYVYDRIVSLPIHSAMSAKDAGEAAGAVKKILNYYSKKQ